MGRGHVQLKASFATALSTVVAFYGMGTSVPSFSAQHANEVQEQLERRHDALTAPDLPALEARAVDGDAESQFLLGLVHLEGHLVPKDENAGWKWLQLAAAQGQWPAELAIAESYHRGSGVRRDYREAMKWYLKAAAHGSPTAMYLDGNGVTKDYAKALDWFQKAATQGLVQAQAKVGLLYKNQGRDKHAAEWTRKAAEQGDLMAQLNLAGLYAEGRGVPRDHQQSFMWILIARATVCEPSFEAWKGMTPSPDTALLTLRDQERAKLSSEQRQQAENATSDWLEKNWPGGEPR